MSAGGQGAFGRASDAERLQRTFSTFIKLEDAARRAETLDAWRFVVVNETKRLFGYRQAVLATVGAGRRPRVEAVSGVAVVERNAPFVRWLERVMAALARGDDASGAHVVARQSLGEAERADWDQWCAPHVLWLPLKHRDGGLAGVLWLTRDMPWQDAEILLGEQLANAYAHAGQALSRRRGLTARRGGRRRKLAAALVATAALAALAAPVRQSALAPAEVVARDPVVVAAPLDGVIKAFSVAPNQPVRAGQELFRFDDTKLRSRFEVARRTLDIARAELRRASQGAFNDRESSARIDLLRARVKLREAELDHARALLDRVVVTAERDGVAVFTHANDWIGRPVVTGERVMEIADPARTELRIELPVADAIVLEQGAPVELFLDAEPLKPRAATLRTASYEAEVTPSGTLAYRVTAAFGGDADGGATGAATGGTNGGAPPRVGLHGTAKIYGEQAPLALYLFRRPLSAVRRALGL